MKRIAVIEICEECHKRPYCVLRKFDDCPHLDSLEAHDAAVREEERQKCEGEIELLKVKVATLVERVHVVQEGYDSYYQEIEKHNADLLVKNDALLAERSAVRAAAIESVRPWMCGVNCVNRDSYLPNEG